LYLVYILTSENLLTEDLIQATAAIYQCSKQINNTKTEGERDMVQVLPPTGVTMKKD
jgi:hypothetical protein